MFTWVLSYLGFLGVPCVFLRVFSDLSRTESPNLRVLMAAQPGYPEHDTEHEVAIAAGPSLARLPF